MDLGTVTALVALVLSVVAGAVTLFVGQATARKNDVEAFRGINAELREHIASQDVQIAGLITENALLRRQVAEGDHD